QFERHDGIRRALAACRRTTARGSDDDILRLVIAHVGHRRRVAIRRKIGDPQFLARPRVERTETLMHRRTDEHKSAAGWQAPAACAAPAARPAPKPPSTGAPAA